MNVVKNPPFKLRRHRWQGTFDRGGIRRGEIYVNIAALAIGADLVSDDQTIITLDGKRLKAEAPVSIRGLIEARGLGILTVPSIASAAIKAIIDLDYIETERLPGLRTHSLMGVILPCLHNVDCQGFPSGLLHYLRHGRQDVT